MRLSPRLRCLGVAVAALAALGSVSPKASASLGPPELFADLNKDPKHSSPVKFAAAGSQVFFVASHFLHGKRLWVTDGTAAGTRVLSTSPSDGTITTSRFSEMIEHAGELYFVYRGDELWRSDGTDAGTVLVKKISNGSEPGNISQLASAGPSLYFAADKGNGMEPWRSDGTAAGTKLLKNINTQVVGETGSHPKEFIQVGSSVYFSAYDPVRGRELWSTDGKPSHTQLVEDIWPLDNGSSPQALTALGASLVFVAETRQQGFELWRSDGTPAGTDMIAALGADQADGVAGEPAGATGPATPPLIRRKLGGSIYFSPSAGGGLWRTDGTAAGTGAVSPVAIDATSPLYLADGKLFFDAEGMWRSDGTPAGTFEVGPDGALTAVGPTATRILYVVNPGSGGLELWRSDGTLAGTQLVTGVEPGFEATFSAGAALGDEWLFQRSDALTGREPWITDGTASGTQILSDVNPGTGGSQLSDLMAFDGRLAFLNSPPAYGEEPWISDSSEAGAEMITDLTPGPASSFADLQTILGGRLIFTVAQGWCVSCLWSTDGTAPGTSLVYDPVGDEALYPERFVNLGSQVLYLGRHNSSSGTPRLWRSDGTAAGTYRITQVVEAVAPAALGDDAYFAGRDSTTEAGLTLWRTDGTGAGTEEVSDVPLSRTQTEFAVLGSEVFFAASAAGGRELWKSDGTAGGTVRVADINPTGAAVPANLTVMGGRVYFSATDGVHGTELWQSDGTESGTKMVKDVNLSGSAAPMDLRAAGTRLYFTATDGVSGREVFRTDGRPSDFGTKPVSSFASASAVETGSLYFPLGEDLVFAANEADTGRELYISDGTASALVADLFPGPLSGFRSPWEMVRVGDRLVFTGNDGPSGDELWALPFSP